MCLRGSWVLSAVFVLGAGCGDDDDRPPCNLGNCFEEDGGGGDADADGDTDADGDGDADEIDCTDPDADGHIDDRCPDEGADDCEEGNRNVHPGATEVCNGIDDNCADGIDEGLLAVGTDVAVASTGLTRRIAFAATADGFALLRLESLFVDEDRLLTLQFLNADGGVSGAPVEIAHTPNVFYTDTIGVAAGDGIVIAAWGDTADRVAEKAMGIVSAAAIRDGQLGEVVSIGEDTFDLTPSVAVGTTTAIVVWNHDYASVRYSVLSLADINDVVATGVLFDSVTPYATRPTVVWTGTSFLAAGYDSRAAARTAVVSETGEITAIGNLGLSGGLAAVGWGGDGGMLVHKIGDLQSLDFVALPIDAHGGQVSPEVDLVVGPEGMKVPRIAGGVTGFAVVAPTGPADPIERNYTGVVRFGLLDKFGTVSNELVPDDDDARIADDDPWVVPMTDGWAVAWIKPGRATVGIDFVRCSE